MTTGERRVLTQAVEDYVKAIFAAQSGGQPATTKALATALGHSPAAATKMLKHLAGLRLVDYTPYAGARLTPAGERVALEILRHHRLLELYLHQALGYGWDEVHAEADQLEHHVSPEFASRIAALMGEPDTDPHGHPIPTSDGRMAPERGHSLADAQAGETVVVRRVQDTDPDALRRLSRLGMAIGTVMCLADTQAPSGPLVVEIGGTRKAIGRELAGHVFVEAAPAG